MPVLAPLMLAVAALSQEPVRVAASLSTDELRVGESVVISIMVETPGVEPERIAIPTIPDQLEIVGRSERRSLSAGGERSRREIRLEITLLALRPGRVVIPPATVVVSGVTHRTHALALAIHGAAVAAEPPPGWEGAELRAWLQPDTVYVGEQALLHVEARIPEGMRRGRARPLSYEPPSPTGFWVHDLPDAGVTVLRSIGDRIIEVQSFRRAYFALDAGEYAFAPARVTYEVRRGFLQPPENQRLESDSLRLVVLPLPDEGRPETFRGAVGRYEVRARIEPARVAVGDIATLVVEIEGTGNVRTLAAPALPPIPGVEVHTPSESAEYATPGGTLTGVKRFRWLLVPRELGTTDIPPIHVAWFDPGARAYRESASEPIRLEVVPGSPAADALLAPIERGPSGSTPDVLPRWWLLLLLPPVGVVAAAAWRRRRGGRAAAAMIARRWQNELAQSAAEAGENTGAWAARVAGILRDAATAVVPAEPLRTASPTELAAALKRAGVVREIADEAADLVSELERIRFAPTRAGHDADTLLVRARRIVDALGRSAATLMLVLLVSLSAAVPARAQAPDAFREGVAAYESGRFSEAADAFARHLTTAPRDAAAWYDLGNAAYRSGAHGRAAHAWLRALWIEPRHDAARANLRASLPAAAAAAPPRTMLSRRQAAVPIIIAWWLGLLAFARALRTRDRRHPWVIGGAIAVALLALALATMPRLRMADAIALDDLPLRLGPTAGSPAPERLQPGTPLDLLEQRDAWSRVRDAAGREGWIETATAAPIRPTSP